MPAILRRRSSATPRLSSPWSSSSSCCCCRRPRAVTRWRSQQRPSDATTPRRSPSPRRAWPGRGEHTQNGTGPLGDVAWPTVSVPDGASAEEEDDPAGVAQDADLVVPARIAHWARVDPGRPFLVEVGGAARSYGEVHEGIMRWASVLVGLGVRPGERVVSLLPPSVDAHLVWLASTCIGALEVSVNPQLRAALLDHVLAD